MNCAPIDAKIIFLNCDFVLPVMSFDDSCHLKFQTIGHQRSETRNDAGVGYMYGGLNVWKKNMIFWYNLL